MPERESYKELSTHEVLKEIIGGEPSVIYLMSGGVAKGNTVDYKSTSMLDPDNADGSNFGYLGGALRVHAVAHLHENFPEATMVTSSVVNDISHAAVQERELRSLWNAWKVPQPKELIQEEKSNSTQTQLAELVRLTLDNNWEAKILLITNDYHTPRVNTMLQHLPELRTQAGDVSFAEAWRAFQSMKDVSITVQAAEPILKASSPKWNNMLATVFTREPWQTARGKRELAESNGITAILNNSYNPAEVRKR